MEVPRDSLLLRIFIGESDRFEHKPLYEAIVLKAREMHLAGAHRATRADGFWEIQSNAHRKNSATLDGFTDGD